MKVLNSNVRIVFTPNEIQKYNRRIRFLISVNRLSFYVGSDNAKKALERFLRSRQDKCTVKLRKYGKIEIYNK